MYADKDRRGHASLMELTDEQLDVIEEALGMYAERLQDTIDLLGEREDITAQLSCALRISEEIHFIK